MANPPYKWVGSGWHDKASRFASHDNVDAYETDLVQQIAAVELQLIHLKGEYKFLQDERSKEAADKVAKSETKSAASKSAASKSAAAPSKSAASKPASKSAAKAKAEAVASEPEEEG